MAGRYLITGVQLGMLIGIEDPTDRKRLVNQIEEEQYLGNSSEDIKSDCKQMIKLWFK